MAENVSRRSASLKMNRVFLLDDTWYRQVHYHLSAADAINAMVSSLLGFPIQLGGRRASTGDG